MRLGIVVLSFFYVFHPSQCQIRVWISGFKGLEELKCKTIVTKIVNFSLEKLEIIPLNNLTEREFSGEFMKIVKF